MDEEEKVDNKKLDRKQFSIDEFKSGKTEDGRTFIEGYANTKGHADRYGDIPTIFPAIRSYVYELKDFKKNPVLLLDHSNNTGNIAGSFSEKHGGYITEDEKGLKFKAIFSESDFPPVKHARTVYAEGHGKALSIGGKWSYEDKDNPHNLTYAEIFEVSLVGVGADQDALTKKIEALAEGQEAKINKLVEELSSDDPAEPKAVITDGKAGRVLSKANEDKIRKAVDTLSEVLKTLEKLEELKEEEEEKCQKKVIRLRLTRKS